MPSLHDWLNRSIKGPRWLEQVIQWWLTPFSARPVLMILCPIGATLSLLFGFGGVLAQRTQARWPRAEAEVVTAAVAREILAGRSHIFPYEELPPMPSYSAIIHYRFVVDGQTHFGRCQC